MELILLPNAIRQNFNSPNYYSRIQRVSQKAIATLQNTPITLDNKREQIETIPLQELSQVAFETETVVKTS